MVVKVVVEVLVVELRHLCFIIIIIISVLVVEQRHLCFIIIIIWYCSSSGSTSSSIRSTSS